MRIFDYLNTIFYLVKADYIVFKQTFHDKLIDLFIWIVVMAAVTIYLLPSFGLQITYGSFFIVSMAASAGLFEQFTSTVKLVADFNGDNITSFYLTLPIPSWMVFFSYGIFYAVSTFLLTILVLPISKLCFWSHLDLSQLHVFKSVFIFALGSVFYAVFTLWMASLVPNLERIGNVWMRFIFPIWTLGGFQYSYKVLYGLKPWLAYMSLCNPILYIMEGSRAAVLGQDEYLNFWLCIGMLMVFTCMFGISGFARLKRRLDFV